ncbi:MAG: antitoxin MazE-like protein [Reyranella sp.]
MRLAALRPLQIWVPATRAPGFAAKCRRQARAVAAGDELMKFIDSVRDWPER